MNRSFLTQLLESLPALILTVISPRTDVLTSQKCTGNFRSPCINGVQKKYVEFLPMCYE